MFANWPKTLANWKLANRIVGENCRLKIEDCNSMIELNVILQLFTSSMSFQNLMKFNDVFSDDFRSESWFKLQINFETSIFIFETSRARGKTSRATRNVSVFYSFSGARKYFDISFQSKHLGYRLFFQGGTVFLRGRWRFELDKEEGWMDVILSRLFQGK